MNTPNPFDYGLATGPQPLVGRDAELRQIRRVLRSRGRLVLIGPRRVGKTALLLAASQEAARAGTVVLRVDAERFETSGLLAAALLTAAARSLRRPADRLAALLVRAAPRLRPALAVHPGTGELSVSVAVPSSGSDPVGVLTDALDAVEALAAETRREVVVVLDEVQHLLEAGGPGPARGVRPGGHLPAGGQAPGGHSPAGDPLTAASHLRAAVRRHGHLGYVFAGSATGLLTALTAEPEGPFRDLGEVLVLGPVAEGEQLAYLERTFRASGFAVDDAVCRRILERADGVPYDVQRLAREVWELLRSGQVRGPDATVVDTAVDRIVRRDDPAYAQLWASLTANQKKTLRAVVALDGARLQSAEASRRFEIPAASVQVALAALEDRQLLRREGGGAGRYRLIDPFLAAWLETSSTV
jgi:uncharacterized protein